MDTAKRIAENTVIYKIYPCIKNNSLFTEAANQDVLERVAENCIQKLSGFLSRYFWQNESFNLRVVKDNEGMT